MTSKEAAVGGVAVLAHPHLRIGDSGRFGFDEEVSARDAGRAPPDGREGLRPAERTDDDSRLRGSAKG